MCFHTHTEAGIVQKNSTTLEFLKAAAGYYFVIEREYKKRSKQVTSGVKATLCI